MGAEAAVPLMPAPVLCIALLGPGLISIEDTQRPKPRRPEESGDIANRD